MQIITVKFQPRHEGDEPPDELGSWELNNDHDSDQWSYKTKTDVETFLNYARRVDLLGRINPREHIVPMGIHKFLTDVSKYLGQSLEQGKGDPRRKWVYIGLDGEFGFRDYEPYARDHIYIVGGEDINPDIFGPILEGLTNCRVGEENSLLSMMSAVPPEILNEMRKMEIEHRNKGLENT